MTLEEGGVKIRKGEDGRNLESDEDQEAFKFEGARDKEDESRYEDRTDDANEEECEEEETQEERRESKGMRSRSGYCGAAWQRNSIVRGKAKRASFCAK